MPAHEIAWRGLPLSTSSATARDRYLSGIVALVAAMPHAVELLTQAVDEDPGFCLALIAVAVARVAAGSSYERPVRMGDPPTRGERQHAEVVESAMTGRLRHAHDLRREHLLEYPGDLLVVWLPALVGGGPTNPRAVPRTLP